MTDVFAFLILALVIGFFGAIAIVGFGIIGLAIYGVVAAAFRAVCR